MVPFSVDAEKYLEKALADLRVGSLREAPREHRRRILREMERITLGQVFGVDHKKDANGQPIEQGIGSENNVTRQHVEAYIANQTTRRDTPEAGYEETLAKMRAQLEVCEKRRREERAKEEEELDALP